MREFAKVSPFVWRSEKFKSLDGDDDAKLVYFYILTSPHSNSSGCYDLLEGYGTSDLKWTSKRYRKAIESLCDSLLIDYDFDKETVRIVNWAQFNPPTNSKHALGIIAKLEQASSEKQKSLAAQEFKAVLNGKGFKGKKGVEAKIDTLSKAYRKPIERVSPQRQRLEVDTNVSTYMSDSRFEEFWDAFDDKRGRKEAEQLWKRNKLDEKADVIITAAKSYAFQRPHDKSKCKMAQGWLSGERWNDDHSQPATNRHSRSTSETTYERTVRVLSEKRSGLVGIANNSRKHETDTGAKVISGTVDQ